MLRTSKWIVPAAMVLLIFSRGQGQEIFRMTYDVDRSNPQQVRIAGQISNDARFDALNVYVTAEAFDTTGRVLASGVSYVSMSIPPRGSAPFTVGIPSAPGVNSFRVRVTSFVQGPALQAP